MTIVNRRYLQDQPHTLAGAGVSLGDTSMTLQSFVTIPDGSGVSIPITMDMFGSKGFGTLEQGRPREEQISFTGIVQNPDGTATLTGIKNVLFEYPYTETTGFGKSHAGSVFFVISNNPGLYNSFGNKLNEETIEEKWTFPSIAGDNRPVISADTDAILATELITKGELNRAIQATYLPPTVVSVSSGTTGLVTATSLTISHTIPAGTTDGCTFVTIETQQDVAVSSVLYGASPLTQEASETRVTGNLRTEVWRLLNPSAGTANIVITTSGTAYITGHVITMETVNQSTPVEAVSTGANGSSTSVSDTITTTTPNALILTAVGTGNNPTVFTPTVPLAEQVVNSTGTLRPLSSSVRSTTTSGAYALAYTITPSTNYTTKSIAVRGVQVPGVAGVSSVTGLNTDNTDPANPIVKISVDNVTITGDGTPGNPLIATTGGGGSGFSGGYNFLPVGKVDTFNSVGNFYNNNIFTDAGTNRLYACFSTNQSASEASILRIFRNQFGSYFQENEVTITPSILTNTNPAGIINSTSWTTDGSYLYCVVFYGNTVVTPGSRYLRIDIVRFNLDGTSPTATNIYAITGLSTSNSDSITWNTGAVYEYQGATCVGSSLYLTYKFWNGAVYVEQFREYTISGTTYTLANTYTRSGSDNVAQAKNLQYDATNDQFYMSGLDTSSQSPSITVWKIASTNLVYQATQLYPEMGYGNNNPGSTDSNFYISGVVDATTYNQIFTVQKELGTSGGSPAQANTFAFWLMQYNFPKF